MLHTTASQRWSQVDNMRFMWWDVRRVASNSSIEKFYFRIVQSAVFSFLVWKPLCLLKPDYKRRTYFYLYPLCPSAPGFSPLHQGLICIWMRHSDTEKLHPNSQFCIFNVADIVSSQPSPLHPAGDHGISFLFSFWSNELIVNQHEVCAIKKFWQTHSLSHAATTYLVI